MNLHEEVNGDSGGGGGGGGGGRRGKRDEAIHSIDATASSGTMTTKTRAAGKKGRREELRNGIRRVQQVLIRPIARPYTGLPSHLPPISIPRRPSVLSAR